MPKTSLLGALEPCSKPEAQPSTALPVRAEAVRYRVFTRAAACWIGLLLSFVLARPAWSAPEAQSTPARPKITGVAGIAVKTKDMDTARNFYSTIIGLDEAFPTKNPMGGADFKTFKINERQYVYVSSDLKDDQDSRLWYVSFETADARALLTYLSNKGVSVPARIDPDPEGNLSFIVKDPEGQDVQFIQFMPASVHTRNAGRFLSSRRLSNEALHVGYRIHDADKMDTFYRDILGFRLMWKGGNTENQFRWISMVVPDGTQWLEYMVDTGTPPPRTLDQQAVASEVKARGYAAAATPKIGRDGRWLMDLFDADLTRVEFMIRKPVQTPCCSPLVDPIDKPAVAGGLVFVSYQLVPR
jgi:catechol 2,3-dioxygenase-like lactoylglutathione lyase family enzyme